MWRWISEKMRFRKNNWTTTSVRFEPRTFVYFVYCWWTTELLSHPWLEFEALTFYVCSQRINHCVTQSTVTEWSCTTLQKHLSVTTPYLFAVERHHTKSKSISLQILKLSDFRPSDTTQILKPSNFRPWHKKSILIPKLKSSQVRSATLKPSQHRTPRQKPSQFRCSHENQANDGPIKIESI